MRVLVDMTHPANVHFFKHLIWQLQREGHEVLITAREKDVTLRLLDALGFSYICPSRKSEGILGMAKELVQRNARLVGAARQFRPDVMVAEVGVSIGVAGAIAGVPRVVFDQADRASLQRAVGLPLATVICTGLGYPGHYGKRYVSFRGFLAQAYLDPRRFRPDPEPLRRAGVDPDAPYTVVRLVGWSAAHDIGRKGLIGPSGGLLEQAIARLSRHGRVLISSETHLPDSLRSYQNPAAEAHLHDLLAFADVCLAEGGTVAVEAGVLGTPAVCFNTYDFGYLRLLEEKYGLIRRTRSLAEAMDAAESLFQNASRRREWQQRRMRLFDETEDVAAFMYRVVQEAAVTHRAQSTSGNIAR